MFLLSDLAITTSENEGLALTITPEASLEADFVIRYFITGAGLHPASSGSFLYASGAFEFARGTTAALTTTIGRTVNNLVKDYPKGLSVKIASYEVNEVGGVRTESNESVLLDDQRVTVTDSSDTTAKATHDVPFTSNRDVVNLGNSFDSRDISQGAGDDVVDGGAGTDTIHLGSGKDIITGGTGTDIFTMGSNIGLAEARGTDIFTDFEQGEKIKLDLPNFSDDNKFTGTTIDDVLNAFKMTGQINTWRISQLNAANDSGKNDLTKLDTIIHYGAYGTSDYYIRFIFEDLDFDLTASHFEIV